MFSKSSLLVFHIYSDFFLTGTLGSYKARYQNDFEFGMNSHNDETSTDPPQTTPKIENDDDAQIIPSDADYNWSDSQNSDLLF